MRHRPSIAALNLWSALTGGLAAACCLPTAGAHELELASIERGRAVLGARDEFVARLSPFDRAARMRSAEAVSESEYLAFATAAAREWSNDERVRLAAAFAAIEPKLEELLPELDEPILVVKTSGEEEGGAGYTRGSAIMLPQAHNDERELQRLLAHEIFHVASRNHGDMQRALYRTIGFEECGEVALPASLAARKITNPDAPVNEHCIEVTVDGAEVWAMPILFSREQSFDPAAGRAFFEYLTLGMLLVDRDGATARPRERNGGLALVPLNRVTGFFEQVGRNTDYIIHAEEILASNFERLVVGGDAAPPSPDVLERIRAELARAARN